MPPRQRQPAAPDAAHRRLLADVLAPPPDAGTLVLARRPVRYPAPAAAEDRRPRRGLEDPGDGPPAQRLSRPGHPAARPRPVAAPGDLTHGAVSPRTRPSSQPQAPQSAPLRRHHPPARKAVRA